MVFKPVVVGGQDITSLRAHFDCDDRSVIVTSARQLTYYSVESNQQNGQATIPQANLKPTEAVVGCEKLDTSLYLFTNYGKLFVWNLESRDWTNELSLPIESDSETLISCKLLGKRQYIFTVKAHDTNQAKIYCSMSRSERERPKHCDLIGDCANGLQTDFDIGCLANQHELDETNKTNRDKMLKQRVLAFINGINVHFQRLGLGEKLHLDVRKQTVQNHELTCIRASSKRPMVAVGDKLGRIYIYRGNYKDNYSWSNRTKLHWHRSDVNDICFSSTGKTLYSVGSETGCVVLWDLSENNFGQRRVVASLGMPIRLLNSSENYQELVLSFEDNEVQTLSTDNRARPLKTLARRTYDMYVNNDTKALRFGSGADQAGKINQQTIGMLWHSKTDSIVTNGKTGCLQFYSPRQQKKIESLDCLKSRVLSLENDGRVVPSEITRAAFSSDGDWLAFYETKEPEELFPDVKLHLWQRSNTQGRWLWIQTTDRLHSSAKIVDLKFSPDGQFLVSLGDDGMFHVLYRVNLDAKSANKQMYAKGFFGNVPEKMATMAAFSSDSSVLAISLKDETTSVWMIADPYKLEYECQLGQPEGMEVDSADQQQQEATDNEESKHNSVGLHFGVHDPAKNIAPLCEVRSRYIRIWNILNAQSNSGEMMECLATSGENDLDEFTAAAFDHSTGESSSHFAVSTKKSVVYMFELKINQSSRLLEPLIVIDGSLPQINLGFSRFYTHMCFLNNPILDIDEKSHPNGQLLKVINRLCLMTDRQELVSFTDKLTLERQSAINNFNSTKSYELGELQDYISKSSSAYRVELREMPEEQKVDHKTMTEKQGRIKHRVEVQQMVKSLFLKVPSHCLPSVEELGPAIIDKLVIK